MTVKLRFPPVETGVFLESPPTPNYCVHFSKDGQVIGGLDFNNGFVRFSGDIEISSKVFIDVVSQQWQDRVLADVKTGREVMRALAMKSLVDHPEARKIVEDLV